MPRPARPLFYAALVVFACNRSAAPSKQEASGKSSERSEAQETVWRSKAKVNEPVEKETPNVPDFKPAFAGQTRAPAVRTRTAIRVTELGVKLDKPWAIAFLPDRRMLVTEKHEGKLFIVTPDGEKSPPIGGVPRVNPGGS